MSIDTIVGGVCLTNTYICTIGKNAVIIDPIVPASKLTGLLSDAGCDIKDAYVLVTHGHFDHISSVADLKAFGAKVCISKIDHELLKDCDFDFRLDGFTGTAVKPFEADVLLSDGDVLDIGGKKFFVVSTPGHTPGSLCFVCESEKAIFSGDTLFYMGVGRTDFPHGDGRALGASLKKLLSLDGDYDVYPGHGERTTLDFERKFNCYAI